MDTTYKYNRIDLATDAIRLVRLLKGDQSQPIQCQMFETFLHQIEGVPYEALSYVWGTRISADRIWLDGCEFGVTENLHEALIHLRRPDEDRVLWVDAICIDQSHNGVSDINYSWRFYEANVVIHGICRSVATRSAKCALYIALHREL